MGATCQGQGSAAEQSAEFALRRGPSLKDASHQLERQIDTLERKIKEADADARTWAGRAAADATAKTRAVQLLKQKRMYEQQRDRLLGTHYNVENAQFQEEQADITFLAAQAMQSGANRLKLQAERMPVEALEDIADNFQDLVTELQDAQDALAREAPLEGSEDAEAEWERLQAEAQAERQARAAPPVAGRRAAAAAADRTLATAGGVRAGRSGRRALELGA